MAISPKLLWNSAWYSYSELLQFKVACHAWSARLFASFCVMIQIQSDERKIPHWEVSGSVGILNSSCKQVVIVVSLVMGWSLRDTIHLLLKVLDCKWEEFTRSMLTFMYLYFSMFATFKVTLSLPMIICDIYDSVVSFTDAQTIKETFLPWLQKIAFCLLGTCLCGKWHKSW